MKKYIIITGIIGLVVGFFAGSMFPKGGSSLSAAQLEKLNKLFPITSEMRSVFGTVKEISGNVITLQMAEPANPFDSWPTIRKVTVADSTKIIKMSAKNQEVYLKELDAYRKAIKSDAKLPSYLLETVLKLSDIKMGEKITVEADHNIKNETEFTATKITVNAITTPGIPRL